MQAAREATAEIGLAVMATTASILAVFVPVATMKGIIGRFFVQFGLTVAFAVSVSLFVAFTLTPMLSSRFLRAHTGKGPVGRTIERLPRRHRARLQASARGRAQPPRRSPCCVALVVLVGSVALVTPCPSEFMPTEDRGQFSVKLELPTGSSLGLTETTAENVATAVARPFPA